MMFSRRMLLGYLLLGLLAEGACVSENSQYCEDDYACPASKPYCHGEGHFCHEGCTEDEDCLDPTKPWYAPDRRTCNLVTHDCVADTGDGGPPDGLDGGGDAAPPKKDNGKPCASPEECISGNCVDEVCCDSLCDSPCTSCDLAASKGTCSYVPNGQDSRKDCVGKDANPACDGHCDGKGLCIYPANKLCGKISCAAGEVTKEVCNDQGACVTANNNCGGFACDATTNDCKASCTTKADCEATFECVGIQCVSNLPIGSDCGTNPNACASGFCAHGVCCDAACTATCDACNLAAAKGTCTKVPVGQDPNGDCVKTDPACAGKCDGVGACTFPGATTTCGTPNCSGGDLTAHTCDGTGGCGSKTTPCSPYPCASTTACAASCLDHAGCVATSACDRRQAHAHPQGQGSCVPAGQIVTVGSTQEIADVLSLVTAGNPFVVVPPKTYTKALSISGKSVHLIGKGTTGSPVTLDPAQTGAAIQVLSGAAVSIQGLVIQGATGAGADGVYCQGSPGTKSDLTVVETTLSGNVGHGVQSLFCDVTLRRNTIQTNQAGGAKLSDGAFTIVNNLVSNNNGTSGTLGSNLGGFYLTSAASVAFTNNTVADNLAKTGAVGGVFCGGAYQLKNSILWNNSGSEFSSCTFTHSDVDGLTPSGSNISVDPSFDNEYKPQETQCHDSGDDTTPGFPTIDLAGKTRILGAGVDMGAYEVK